MTRTLKFTALLTASWILATGAQAQDTDKIGTANVNQLVDSYHKTKALRDKFASYGEEVGQQRDERIKAIEEAANEFKELQRKGQQDSISDEERSKLLSQAAAKQREARGLQQDLQNWLRRRQAALNERVAMEMTDVRKEVLSEVAELGKKEGYDFIFDRTGSSTAGVPVLVYTKDATDLTGVLLEILKGKESE